MLEARLNATQVRSGKRQGCVASTDTRRERCLADRDGERSSVTPRRSSAVSEDLRSKRGPQLRGYYTIARIETPRSVNIAPYSLFRAVKPSPFDAWSESSNTGGPPHISGPQLQEVLSCQRSSILHTASLLRDCQPPCTQDFSFRPLPPLLPCSIRLLNLLSICLASHDKLTEKRARPCIPSQWCVCVFVELYVAAATPSRRPQYCTLPLLPASS